MTGVSIDTVDDEMSVRGDEAGTAPGDRPFRPDVEGLRAVAVLLVVLFHSGVSSLSGGYVGVDVFFVISGFVITGVLLRERAPRADLLLRFYGRRCRRIIPAATLVIIATVIVAYVLGVARDPTADRRAVGGGVPGQLPLRPTAPTTSPSQQPPSPLQNFWSLAVEEQFYVVYPTLFLLVAGAGGPVSGRVWPSAWPWSSSPPSPTRSSIPTRPRQRLLLPLHQGLGVGPRRPGGGVHPLAPEDPGVCRLRHLGRAGGHPCRLTFNARRPTPARWWPSRWSERPDHRRGHERPPPGPSPSCTWPRSAGSGSYSLYLWHWPILIIAAEHAGKTSLSVRDNLGWDLVALAADGDLPAHREPHPPRPRSCLVDWHRSPWVPFSLPPPWPSPRLHSAQTLVRSRDLYRPCQLPN